MKAYVPEVVIIDDEKDMSDILSQTLDPNMRVACFEDASDAVSRMQSGHWPDVIVLDWAMKGMNGIQCLTEIRKSNRDVPVIMMSGADDSSMIFDASKLGISCFLLKPFKFSEFEVHVQHGVLRSRLNKINDHLVRVLGDIVLGLQLKHDQAKHDQAKVEEPQVQSENEERMEALAILSAEAEWYIQYREQTVKEIAGVSL